MVIGAIDGARLRLEWAGAASRELLTMEGQTVKCMAVWPSCPATP